MLTKGKQSRSNVFLQLQFSFHIDKIQSLSGKRKARAGIEYANIQSLVFERQICRIYRQQQIIEKMA